MSELKRYYNRFLQVGALGGAVLALTGNAQAQPAQEGDRLQAIESNANNLPHTYSELVAFLGYDAITNLRPLQQYDFSTDQTHTWLFNLTTEDIPEPQLKTLISTNNSKAEGGFKFNLNVRLPNGDQKKVDFSAEATPEHHRYVLILPPGTPLFDLPPGVYKPEAEAAYTLNNQPQDISLIIARPSAKPGSANKDALQLLYTELCQSTIEVQPQTSLGGNAAEAIARLGQEDECNSEGNALTAAANKIPYQRYKKSEAKKSIRTFDAAHAAYLAKMLGVSKQTYGQYLKILK